MDIYSILGVFDLHVLGIVIDLWRCDEEVWLGILGCRRNRWLTILICNKSIRRIQIDFKSATDQASINEIVW